MKRQLLLIFGVAITLMVFAVAKERIKERKSMMERLRGGLDEALGEVEVGAKELRKRSQQLTGEARSRLQERAQDLEAREHELKERLDDLKSEARRLVEKARV